MGPTKCVFPKPTTSNSFLLPWSLPNPTPPSLSLSLSLSQLEDDNAEARGEGKPHLSMATEPSDRSSAYPSLPISALPRE
ncbi:TBC domain containing protein [Musa troglodytarum]|uniref:TBC domain containing protein n=1 Tax=Musa troglodytarum TaxID=320322 RepID=A0A9E7HLT8_9LILI|nr:TBC domain containing protein [Musa troglodytarum]